MKTFKDKPCERKKWICCKDPVCFKMAEVSRGH